MSDQCRNCVVQGDLAKCLAMNCYQHENWIFVQLKADLDAKNARIKELESENKKPSDWPEGSVTGVHPRLQEILRGRK